MAWRIERSPETDADLRSIFEFLIESHLAFEHDLSEAFQKASDRTDRIEDAIGSLLMTPYQGTLRPELGPGIRSVTKDRAILYFDIDADAEIIRILAVFYGGQDHRRAMLARLRAG